MKPFVIALLCLLTLSAWASVNDYVFTVADTTYTPLENGILAHGPDEYNEYVQDIAIGFDFVYNGAHYTSFGCSSSGYISLGAERVSTRNNDLSSDYYRPVLAALWDRLRTNDPSGNITYRTTGDAPNRVLTVQYTDVKWYYSYSPANLMNFQIKIYETSNRIEFVYGTCNTAPGSSATASVGINMVQNGSTQFLSITPGPTHTYSTTVSNDGIGTEESPYLTSGLIYRLDYQPTPQTIQTLTSDQAGTGTVELGAASQPLISLNAQTTGAGNPLTVSGLAFALTGTLGSGNANLYYSGLSNSFDDSQLLTGPLSFSANQTITFELSQELAEGNNYFWLAVDIPGSYTYLGQTVDATLQSVTTNGQQPGITNPNPDGELTTVDTTAPQLDYSYLSSPYPPYNYTLSGVIITENATMNNVAPRIYFKKSANANVFGTYPADNTASFDGWKYSVGQYADGSWSFTIDPSLIYGGLADGDYIKYFLVAQDDHPTNPNVAADPDSFTGTVEQPLTPPSMQPQYMVILPLNGDYLVGPGQTYTNLTSFLSYAQSRGLEADATALLTGDITEDGNIEFSQPTVYGSNACSLIIKPQASTPVTISGSVSSNGLLRLRGISNIVFDGGPDTLLTINNTHANGKGVQIEAGSANVTLRGCRIFGTGDVSSAAYGVYATGTGIDNLLIENCHISHTNNGVYVNGSSSRIASGSIVRNSIIGSNNQDDWLKTNGIYFTYQTNLQIYGNQIGGILSDGWEPHGIDISRVTNVEIYNNKIHDILYSGGFGFGPKGIYVSYLTGVEPNINIYNNMIWHLGGDGDYPGAIPAAIRLVGDSTGGISICHNSLWLNQDTTYGMGNYDSDITVYAGLIIENSSGSCPTGLTLVNNIISAEVGERTSCTLDSYSAAVLVRTDGDFVNPFSQISNNLYYTNNADNNMLAAHYNGSFSWYSQLQQWSDLTGDTNSIVASPGFNLASPLYINGQSAAAAGGLALAMYQYDIDGELRNNPPCIGADEIEVVQQIDSPNGITINQQAGTITISWLQVNGAGNYNIYTCATVDGEFSLLATTNQTSYTFTPSSPIGFIKVTASN